ncbi:unnamed protein product [Vicia faba]|uniref:Uncharacterized protein n=1 Tax=Vicia faba TaxID=3906 RepID=A0AAV1B1V8_VICFA|nr:unnamed protein product [Vicia faba]
MEIHDQELQPSTREDYNVRPKQQHEEKQHNNVPLDLKIKIPTYEEDKNIDSSNDGFKTPTTMEHKIQAILPPPPRKPKQLHQSKKRKARSNPQVILDLSQEIEFLFSTSPLDLDLGPSNGKNHKKVKRF